MGRKNRVPESKQIVHFECRNDKQKELARSIRDNEVTVCIGPSGTGKSFVTIAQSLQLLEQGYKTIYLVKSVTSMEKEEIGFLKGSLQDKMEPIMMSFTWTIDKLIGKNASKNLMEKDLVSVLPLAFVRGLSIDDGIVIVDESQNLSKHAFKTIMTRIGSNSKYIFLGDIEQIDRKNKKDSCLETVFELFGDSEIIGTIDFTHADCVRNPIIPKILEKLREKEF